MALQFDGVTVGAMQYNGVTIGEAMIDGHIVYRSSIYPLSGGWGPQSGFGGVRDTHRMVESGMFRITHTLSTISGTGGGTIRAAISGPVFGTVSGPNSPTSTLTVEWSLHERAWVEFRVATGPDSVNATGTWLIERI